MSPLRCRAWRDTLAGDRDRCAGTGATVRAALPVYRHIPESRSPVLDPRDEAYVQSEPDPAWREVMRCALTTYRQPDVLAVGDAIPSLTLTQLGSGEAVALDAPWARPLVLFFGSFT